MHVISAGSVFVEHENMFCQEACIFSCKIETVITTFTATWRRLSGQQPAKTMTLLNVQITALIQYIHTHNLQINLF